MLAFTCRDFLSIVEKRKGRLRTERLLELTIEDGQPGLYDYLKASRFYRVWHSTWELEWVSLRTGTMNKCIAEGHLFDFFANRPTFVTSQSFSNFTPEPGVTITRRDANFLIAHYKMALPREYVVLLRRSRLDDPRQSAHLTSTFSGVGSY